VLHACVTYLSKSWRKRIRACLVSLKFQKKIYYIKKRFPVTLNLRYMYGVLNVDEIKN
jgi:hypothetical protein